ncbi:hypothetical protein PITC_035810 [Penicillium italicum]|uniref:Uncharacterized protein n=1 Tax=Penicillium italicum TaxID=40296 RepID=A0A0A2LGA3_PENIT|nr:hypothetical protein PITC_035810 [Penicillium italicum]
MSIGNRAALVCKLGEKKHLPLIKNPSFPDFADGTAVAENLEEKSIQIDDREFSLSLNSSETTASQPSYTINEGEVDRSVISIGNTVISEPGLLHHDDVHIQDNRETPRDYPRRDNLEAEEYAASTEIFEGASLEGIATVFSGLICGSIRTSSFSTNGKTYSKASVTTVFPPWGGPVDCLLSLDICESRVQTLAMALFNATVKWVGKSLHIGFERGSSLTVPNSEATLKGVGNESIVMVFGSEIHQAIDESRIRLRELDEGRMMTECVSMIVTEKGAIINLSLGLVCGSQIKKKLHT